MMAPLLKKLRKKYFDKKSLAKRDGIPFQLSLHQYVELALASAQAQNIGCRKGQYCLCRRDHSLGYFLGNVFIGKADENWSERNHRCGPPQGKSLKRLSKKQRAQRKRAQQRRWRKRHPNYSRDYHRARRACQLLQKLEYQIAAVALGTAAPSNDD